MSEHNHECGCGCGHDHNHDEDELLVTLTLEDDTELDCEVIAIYPASNGKSYAAVTPVDETSDDLFFFRVEPSEEDEDEAILNDIEDEDELEIAADAFDELLDESEWDELTEE
ncbi:MAG: DUF1292 domain-containing protein [Lachnospiraceae bacterium]|nr:DUF1292 domain-containing protein [Lachnospiraceae bacterium]